MTKEETAVYNKKYREEHKEKIASAKKEYREKHKEELVIYKKKYYEENKEIIAGYSKKYYEENKEIASTRVKKYFEENSKTIKIYQKKYRENNIERYRRYQKKYKKIERETNPSFKVLCNLRTRLNKTIKGSHKHTVDLVGCSITELMVHLESKFTEGMAFENYGSWHIDHIRPCNSFNLLNEEEQKECFNYKNLQPLWAADNLIKSDKYLTKI